MKEDKFPRVNMQVSARITVRPWCEACGLALSGDATEAIVDHDIIDVRMQPCPRCLEAARQKGNGRKKDIETKNTYVITVIDLAQSWAGHLVVDEPARLVLHEARSIYGAGSPGALASLAAFTPSPESLVQFGSVVPRQEVRWSVKKGGCTIYTCCPESEAYIKAAPVWHYPEITGPTGSGLYSGDKRGPYADGSLYGCERISDDYDDL